MSDNLLPRYKQQIIPGIWVISYTWDISNISFLGHGLSVTLKIWVIDKYLQ